MNNEPVAWAVWEGSPHDLFFYKEEADELCRLKGGDAKTVPLYTHPVKELTDEKIIESLAELEHEQWMKWADTIMQTEKISDARFARWASCMIPYADLTEEMKEFDKEWARKALAILRKAQSTCNGFCGEYECKENQAICKRKAQEK